MRDRGFPRVLQVNGSVHEGATETTKIGGAGAVSAVAGFGVSGKAGTEKPHTAHTGKSLRIFLIQEFLLLRLRAGLAGADANDLLEIEYEDLAVADLAGVRGFLDRFDHL